VKLAYGTSVDLDVTNLIAAAASATWVAGWESAVIDNTANLYEDYLLSGLIKVLESGAVTAGEIRVYVFAMVSDTAYPDVMDGTESEPETWTTAGIRDAVAKLAAVIVNATTQAQIYPFGPVSVANLFGGICPPKFSLFITQSTAQNLGDVQVVTIQGVYHNVAAS